MRPMTIVLLTVALALTVPLAGLTGLPDAGAAAAANHEKARADELPTVDEVLERYYDALGGREALERIASRVCTGRVVDDRPYAGPATVHRFEAYGRPGGQWAYVEHAPDGDVGEGFNGESSWNLGDGELTHAKGANRSKLAFILDPQGPLLIREYFGEMNAVEAAVYEGRSVYAIESDRDSNYYTLYFDVATGLLTNIGYHWYLEDYRVVDGVLMPHRVVTGRKGGSVTHAFDEIVTNTPVSGGRFDPPGGEGCLK